MSGITSKDLSNINGRITQALPPIPMRLAQSSFGSGLRLGGSNSQQNPSTSTGNYDYFLLPPTQGMRFDEIPFYGTGSKPASAGKFKVTSGEARATVELLQQNSSSASPARFYIRLTTLGGSGQYVYLGQNGPVAAKAAAQQMLQSGAVKPNELGMNNGDYSSTLARSVVASAQIKELNRLERAVLTGAGQNSSAEYQQRLQYELNTKLGEVSQLIGKGQLTDTQELRDARYSAFSNLGMVLSQNTYDNISNSSNPGAYRGKAAEIVAFLTQRGSELNIDPNKAMGRRLGELSQLVDLAGRYPTIDARNGQSVVEALVAEKTGTQFLAELANMITPQALLTMGGIIGARQFVKLKLSKLLPVADGAMIAWQIAQYLEPLAKILSSMEMIELSKAKGGFGLAEANRYSNEISANVARIGSQGFADLGFAGVGAGRRALRNRAPTQGRAGARNTQPRVDPNVFPSPRTLYLGDLKSNPNHPMLALLKQIEAMGSNKITEILNGGGDFGNGIRIKLGGSKALPHLEITLADGQRYSPGFNTKTGRFQSGDVPSSVTKARGNDKPPGADEGSRARERGGNGDNARITDAGGTPLEVYPGKKGQDLWTDAIKRGDSSALALQKLVNSSNNVEFLNKFKEGVTPITDIDGASQGNVIKKGNVYEFHPTDANGNALGKGIAITRNPGGLLRMPPRAVLTAKRNSGGAERSAQGSNAGSVESGGAAVKPKQLYLGDLKSNLNHPMLALLKQIEEMSPDRIAEILNSGGDFGNGIRIKLGGSKALPHLEITLADGQRYSPGFNTKTGRFQSGDVPTSVIDARGVDNARSGDTNGGTNGAGSSPTGSKSIKPDTLGNDLTVTARAGDSRYPRESAIDSFFARLNTLAEGDKTLARDLKLLSQGKPYIDAKGNAKSTLSTASADGAYDINITGGNGVITATFTPRAGGKAFAHGTGVNNNGVPRPLKGTKTQRTDQSIQDTSDVNNGAGNRTASGRDDGVLSYAQQAARAGEVFGVRDNGKIDVAVRKALVDRLTDSAKSDATTVEEALRRWEIAEPKQRASELAAAVIDARKGINGIGGAEASLLLEAARKKIKDPSTSEQQATEFAASLSKYDSWNTFYKKNRGGLTEGGDNADLVPAGAGGRGRGPKNPNESAATASETPAPGTQTTPLPTAVEMIPSQKPRVAPEPDSQPKPVQTDAATPPRASDASGAPKIPRGVSKELDTRYGKGNWEARPKADGGGGYDIYSSSGGRGGRRLPEGSDNAAGNGNGSRKLGEIAFDGSGRTSRALFSPENKLGTDGFAVSTGKNFPVPGLFISDRVGQFGELLDGGASAPRRPTAWLDSQIKRLEQIGFVRGSLAVGETAVNAVTSKVFDRLVKARKDLAQASGDRLGNPLRRFNAGIRGGKYANQIKKAKAERDKLLSSGEKVIEATNAKLGIAAIRDRNIQVLNQKLKRVEQRITDAETRGQQPQAADTARFNDLRQRILTEARTGAKEVIRPELDKLNASIEKWEKKVAKLEKAIDARQADYDRSLQSSMGVDTPAVIKARKLLAEAKSELTGHDEVAQLKRDLQAEQAKNPGQETEAVLEARTAYEQAKQQLRKNEPSADHPEYEAMFDRELGIKVQLEAMKARAKGLEDLGESSFVTPEAYDFAARDAQWQGDVSTNRVDRTGYGDAVNNHFNRIKSALEADSMAALDKQQVLENSQLVVSADGVVTQRSVDAAASSGPIGSLVDRVGHSHTLLKKLAKRVQDLGNTKKVSAGETELAQAKSQVGQTEQLLVDLRQAQQTNGGDIPPEGYKQLISKAEIMLKDVRKKVVALEGRVSLEQRAAEPGQMSQVLDDLRREVDVNNALLAETKVAHRKAQAELQRKVEIQTDVVERLERQIAGQQPVNQASNRETGNRNLTTERAKLQAFADEFAANDAALGRAIEIASKSDGMIQKAESTILTARGTSGYTPGKIGRGALRAVGLYATAATAFTGVQLATGNARVDSSPAEVQLLLKQLNLAPLETTGGLPEVQLDTKTGRFAAKLKTGWVVGYRVRGDLADAMVVVQLGPQSRGALVGAFMGGRFDNALSGIFQPGKLGSLSPSIQKGTSGMYLTLDSEKVALGSITVSTVAKVGSTAVSYQNIWKIEAAPVGVSLRLNTGGANPRTGKTGLMGELAVSHGAQIPFRGIKLGKTGLSIPSFLSPPVVGGISYTQSTRINAGMLSMVYDPFSGVGTVNTRDANYAGKLDLRTGKPLVENNQFTQPYGQAGLVYFRLEPNYYGLYDADNYAPNSPGYQAMEASKVPKAVFDTLTFKAFLDPQKVWDTATKAPTIPKDMPKTTP